MNSLLSSVVATGAVAVVVVAAIGLPSFDAGVAHDENHRFDQRRPQRRLCP